MTNVGRKKKLAMEFTTQQKQNYVYQKDCLVYKPALGPS
jgi:hypothetical protein